MEVQEAPPTSHERLEHVEDTVTYRSADASTHSVKALKLHKKSDLTQIFKQYFKKRMPQVYRVRSTEKDDGVHGGGFSSDNHIQIGIQKAEEEL